MKQSKKNKTIIPSKSDNLTENKPRKNTYLLYILLFATFALFLNTLGHNFTNRDDDQYITGNPLIKDGSMQGFLNLFTTPYSWNYHPLTALSNWIEYKFWGMNPKPFHFFNILLHVFNTLLVYRFILALRKNTWIALLVASLFALHPMHVESVAWASERKDLLYTFFALMSLLSYGKFLDQKQIKYLLLTAAFFLLSLLSKSAAVIVPILFLLMDYYKHRSLSLKMFLEKIPFFALSLVFGIIALNTQKTAIQFAPEYSITEKFFIVNYSLSFYIAKLFFPFQLSALYSFPKDLTLIHYLSPLLTGTLLFICFKVSQFKREIIFGLLFYLAAVLLVSQIIPVGDAIVSERYSYLSYIGLFFILANLYVEKISGSIHLKKYAQPLLIVFLILLVFQTWNRNKVWKNSITLWKDVLEKSESKVAYLGLGNANVGKGDYEEAIRAFTKGIELDSTSKELYHNRANAYRVTNNFNSAMSDLSVIIKKWPDANAYSSRGALFNVNKEWMAALNDLNKAIALDSTQYNFYWERGVSKYNLNDLSGAIKDYSKALLHNKDPQIYANRGVAYYQANEKQKACEDWRVSSEMGNGQATLYIRDYCK
jgi:tetratricopeptide (TPR) repeat protein